MKKLLLGLGTLASVAAPVAAVVACGSSTPEAKFVDPSDTQKSALEDLATSISTDDAKAAGLTEKEVKVKGDTVQITLSKPTTPAGTADAPDAPEIVAARYTADLSTKVLTSVEYKNEGESFVAVNNTDLATLKGTIDAHVATAVTAIKDAALATAKTAAIAKLDIITDLPADAKTTATTAINAATDQAGIDTALAAAHSAATPAPAQGGHSGSTADIDQAAVDAEQAVINGLTSVDATIDPGDIDVDMNGNDFSPERAKELGITGFVKNPGYTYTVTATTTSSVTVTVSAGVSSITGTTPIAITLNFKAAGTPVGGTGTGTGTSAPAVKAAADSFDKNTGTVSVTVNVEDDDFDNHIAGEAAVAIGKVLKAETKKTADVRIVSITIIDGAHTYTETANVGTADATNPNQDAAHNVVVNVAINSAAEKAADADKADGGRDRAQTASDYDAKLAARITAVKVSAKDFNDANKLMDALGNATRFLAGNKSKTAFGTELTFDAKYTTIGAYLKGMLDANLFGTFGTDVTSALTAKIAEFNA